MSPCNVLILGKAHIAAPRIALRRPDFSADIFAMPGHSQIALELDGRTIVTRDDEVRRKMVYCNGVPDLPVSGHDGFVVIGGLAFHQLAGLQDCQRSADFRLARRDRDFSPVPTGFIDGQLRHQIGQLQGLRMVRLPAALRCPA